MPHPYRINDRIDFSSDGEGKLMIPCVIMEVDEEGYITKLRASHPDESLCKRGFIYEHPHYVVIQYDILNDN